MAGAIFWLRVGAFVPPRRGGVRSGPWRCVPLCIASRQSICACSLRSVTQIYLQAFCLVVCAVEIAPRTASFAVRVSERVNVRVCVGKVYVYIVYMYMCVHMPMCTCECVNACTRVLVYVCACTCAC